MASQPCHTILGGKYRYMLPYCCCGLLCCKLNNLMIGQLNNVLTPATPSNLLNVAKSQQVLAMFRV